MRPAVVRLGWTALLLVVAAVHLGSGWQGWVPGAVFSGAVAVAFACVPLVRWRAVPTGLTLLCLVGFALTAAYWVARDTAETTDPATVLLDLVPRLLTAARPAPATPELLLPGVLLVFGVALAVAVSAGGRSLLGPAVGVAVLYTCAALLTAGRADRYGVVALALVALVLLGWLVVDRLESGGRLVTALPAVPVAVVALLAGVLPATGAFEPRELVEPPVTDLGVTNPLPQLASWANLGSAELFRVRGRERAIRLAALSDYSGAAWRAASLYGPLGAVAAPDLPPGTRTTEAEVEVTIGELTGSWVPTVGRPTSVSLDGAMVDPNSGSLVLLDDLTPGLSYRVRGVVDVPDDADLVRAGVPAGDRARRYLALPGLPFSLAEYARQIAQNARTPFEKAVAIEQVVKTGRVPDAGAPVGSSYARLERFLFGGEGEPGAGAGTAEQFASAFAVLGRAVGLPTRVVVGFQPSSDAPGSAERVVRGSDATAWPEVYFEGWGWVPFDPLAGSSSGGSSAAAKREVLDRLASITATPTTTALSAPPPYIPPSSATGVQAAPAPSRQWLGLAFLGSIPPALLLVLGVLRFGRRRRLKRSGAQGAWDHVLDVLLVAGLPQPRDRTAPEIARSLSLPVAAHLAELADRSAFAPSEGLAARGGRPKAWPLAVQTAAALKRRVPWYRRLFWSVDPRPLWRR